MDMENKLDLKYELNRMLYELIDNNDKLEKIVATILSDYVNGLYHIMFLHKLEIKGNHLLKLYEKSCNSNIYLLMLTLNMMEKATFSISEINDNLNLDNPISFVSDISDDVLEPKFYNFLDEHKDFLEKQHEIFKKKLRETKTSKKL